LTLFRSSLKLQDAEIAAMMEQMRAVKHEVKGLRRVRRREEVNLEYLKAVVVDYIAFPPGSSERRSLEHVLSSLLQFTPEDRKKIEKERQGVAGWLTFNDIFAAIRPVKDIQPPQRLSRPPATAPPTASYTSFDSNLDDSTYSQSSSGSFGEERAEAKETSRGGLAGPLRPQLHGGGRMMSHASSSLDGSFTSSTLQLSEAASASGGESFLSAISAKLGSFVSM